MAIESPCVKVCVVDRIRNVCVGCGRTLDEIAGWAGLPPEERVRIMAELPVRLADLPTTASVRRPRDAAA